MHELSIAMSILESLEEESEQRGLGAVEAIHVRVGALSGVVPEALQSAYELAAGQTPFAAARLVIEAIPVAIFCAVCQGERPVTSPAWMCCAECGTPSGEIVRGRELQIAALELAT